MPATNVTDYFFEAKPRAAGKVGADGVASESATTFPHTFVGLTEGNCYIVTANRVNSTGTTKNPVSETETFIGKVNSDNFINCLRGLEGVPQAWAADIVLEILSTATGWNKLLEGIEVEHNPDGTHKYPPPVKATGAEINTGTDDAKFTTAKAIADSTITTAAKTQTLTNKRITKRVQSVTDAATITPSWDNDDDCNVTAIAQAFTLANPSGTPTANQTIVIRIKDNGTGRAITFGNQYRAIGVTLPTTTTASKTLYIGGKWNATDSKVDVLAVSVEA